MIPALEKYAKHGLIGVILAMLALIGYLFYSNNSLVTNHWMHTDTIIQKNTEIMTELKSSVQENTKALEELRYEILIKK